MWASAGLERSSTPSCVAGKSPELPIGMNWSVAQLVLAALERSSLFTKSARESRGNEKLLLRTASTIARPGRARTNSEIRDNQLKNPVHAVRPPFAAVTMKISGSRPVYTEPGRARGLNCGHCGAEEKGAATAIKVRGSSVSTQGESTSSPSSAI